MNDAKLTISLVTPERRVAKAQVREVRAPSVQGQLGILPSHQALLVDLESGVVELVTDEGTERIAISGVFLEVDHDEVVILAETAEKQCEIDRERALKSFHEAEVLQKTLSPEDAHYEETQARIKRAEARLLASAPPL